MEIDINTLYEKLFNYKPKLVINNEHSTLVKSVRLFTENQLIFKTDYLYIGKLSNLPKHIPKDKCINLLCISDISFSTKKHDNQSYNLLILTKNEELETVFNIVQDIFSTSLETIRRADRLLDSLVHGRGLQHIIHIGYELLKNPIILLDNKSNLIAHFSSIETDDPIHCEYLTKGSFSHNAMNLITSTYPNLKAKYKRYPFIFKNKDLKYDRIIGDIYIGDKVTATFIVWGEENPIKDEDVDLVAQLCDVISVEIQKTEFYKDLRASAYETFMLDLIDGKIKVSEVIAERSARMGWEINHNLFLMIIDINDYDNTYSTIARIRDFVETLICDNCKTFIYNNYVLVLVESTEKSLNTMITFKDLIDFLRSNKMYAGVSGHFDSLSDIPKRYAQALKAMELGIRTQSNQVIFTYEEYSIYHIIELSSNNIDLMDFCHHKTFELIEYDKVHNTDYAKTLYSYIINGKDSVLTANALFVHRNTILYRIVKIKELFDIDFSDGKLLNNITITFKILKYLNILSSDY